VFLNANGKDSINPGIYILTQTNSKDGVKVMAKNKYISI